MNCEFEEIEPRTWKCKLCGRTVKNLDKAPLANCKTKAADPEQYPPEPKQPCNCGKSKLTPEQREALKQKQAAIREAVRKRLNS